MKVSKAIEILQLKADEATIAFDIDFRDAVVLGIEALKRIKGDRGTSYQPIWYPLPGETPEEEVNHVSV